MLPRLTAPAEGTAVYAAPATLTAGQDPAPLADAFDEVSVEGDRVEVRWADDGSRTGVAFDPLTVNRIATQGTPAPPLIAHGVDARRCSRDS